MHAEADTADDVLRISLDCKASVKIGLFSRGGSNWVQVKASDHDFKPEATLTPFGILLPRYQDLFLYLALSKVTSDFMVDTLEEWWQRNRNRFAWVRELIVDLDKGPENHSRRTQFLHRMAVFAWK